MNNEKWKSVPGYENYEVSNTGKVFSKTKNRELSQQDHNGYCIVDLVNKDGRKHLNVHRLVMLAFIGKPPKDKKDVNHKDGNKKNNNLSNLEYCSRSYNLKHRYSVLGYKSPNGFRDHVLTDDDITQIRRLRGDKRKDMKYEYTIDDLAKMFNVCKQTIMCIIYRCGVYKNRGE